MSVPWPFVNEALAKQLLSSDVYISPSVIYCNPPSHHTYQVVSGCFFLRRIKMKHLYGLGLLFTFYFEHLGTLRSLPLWMRNPKSADSVILKASSSKQKASCSEPQQVHLSVSNLPRMKYERGIDALKQSLRSLHAGSRPINYKWKLILLFLVRIVTAAVAFTTGNLSTTVIKLFLLHPLY